MPILTSKRIPAFNIIALLVGKFIRIMLKMEHKHFVEGKALKVKGNMRLHFMFGFNVSPYG
jgi:hypothetical protein